MPCNSLTNKRNTKLIEIVEDHPTRNTKVVTQRALEYHGKRTCVITYDASGHAYGLYVSLCGFDTVSTRSKINAFLAKYLARRAYLQRVNGTTLFTHYCANDGTATMTTMETAALIKIA